LIGVNRGKEKKKKKKGGDVCKTHARILARDRSERKKKSGGGKEGKGSIRIERKEREGRAHSRKKKKPNSAICESKGGGIPSSQGPKRNKGKKGKISA